jgi:hypothetical protein
MTETPDWVVKRRNQLIWEQLPRPIATVDDWDSAYKAVIDALIAEHTPPPPEPVEQLARKVMAAYHMRTFKTTFTDDEWLELPTDRLLGLTEVMAVMREEMDKNDDD